MSSNGNHNATGLTISTGFCGLLGIAFIVLKLCGVIDWSWWLVLLPIYGPPALVVAFIGACLAFIGACFTYEWLKYEAKKKR